MDPHYIQIISQGNIDLIDIYIREHQEDDILNLGLLHAVRSGSYDTIKYFLQQGADPNFMNDDSVTVSILSLRQQKRYLSDLINLLYSYGGNFSITDNEGSNAALVLFSNRFSTLEDLRTVLNYMEKYIVLRRNIHDQTILEVIAARRDLVNKREYWNLVFPFFVDFMTNQETISMVTLFCKNIIYLNSQNFQIWMLESLIESYGIELVTYSMNTRISFNNKEETITRFILQSITNENMREILDIVPPPNLESVIVLYTIYFNPEEYETFLQLCDPQNIVPTSYDIELMLKYGSEENINNLLAYAKYPAFAAIPNYMYICTNRDLSEDVMIYVISNCKLIPPNIINLLINKRVQKVLYYILDNYPSSINDDHRQKLLAQGYLL